MQNIYREIFWGTTKYVVLRNIFMVITGVISIFIVRLLGPSEYGKYSLVWNLISTVGPILSLGWLNTLARFIPETSSLEEKSKLFSQSLSLVLLICSLFLVVFLSAIKLIPKFFPAEIKQIAFIFSLFVCLVAIFNIFEGMYRGLGKFNRWTIIDGIRSNLSILFALILLVFGYKSFKTVIMSSFLITILFALVLFFHLSQFIVKPKQFLPNPTVRKFLLTMLSGQVIFLLSTNIDSVLLRALLKDPTQVGLYNAGIRIPKMIETMLIGPLSVPFLYYFSHPEIMHSKEKILEFGSKMLGILLGMISLFLFSFSKEIIVIIFGSQYLSSVEVLQMFSLVLFILGFLILFSPYIYSINQPLIPLLFGGVNFVLVLVLNLIFVPKFKIVGPSLSIFFSLVILGILYPIVTHQPQCLKNFIFLLFGVGFSIIMSMISSVYFAFPIFVGVVWLTKMFTLNDIKLWYKIVIVFRRN
ncbi:MAG: oligosaccharide flippase family protein [Elusimicrobiota bacterium]|nr:oligosaccharide flippase family protein [Endomicrobiia bacterium]MDW8166478.1 oligosaccharide flippase family protein [Elusimicrobiota bacterium]